MRKTFEMFANKVTEKKQKNQTKSNKNYSFNFDRTRYFAAYMHKLLIEFKKIKNEWSENKATKKKRK